MQSIFITGAASGIGRATAELFHERGWFVGAYDVDEALLAELASTLGSKCHAAALDVTDKSAFDAAMAEFATLAGNRLDLLFNNAGIAVAGNFDDVPFERHLDVVNVNLLGVINGVYAAIPLLRQTENALCFTTSSAAATFGSPGLAVYAATKYGVKGLTEALSVELARYGVRASDVLPGIIDTAIWKSERYESDRTVTSMANVPRANEGRNDAMRTVPPSDVAECVWQAYHGDKLHWYVPAEVVERDRATAASPEEVRDEMIRTRG